MLVAALFALLGDTRAPFERMFFDLRGGRLSGAKRASASPLAGLYASPTSAPVRAALADFVPVLDAELLPYRVAVVAAP